MMSETQDEDERRLRADKLREEATRWNSIGVSKDNTKESDEEKAGEDDSDNAVLLPDESPHAYIERRSREITK